MKKTLYDILVTDGTGQWWPIGCARTRWNAEQQYQEWIALGGIKGEHRIVPRIHYLYLQTGR